MPILEIRGLSKSFGGVKAIDELEMHVEPGEIVSVIGPNGAGKTTLFNLITGLLPPDGGEILLEDHDLVGMRPSKVLELGISRTFQNVRLFPEMTVRENVMVAQHCRTKAGVIPAIFRLNRREEEQIRKKAEDTLAFFGSRLVGYRFDQTAMSLSYANRRRLEIARAMASDPRIVLLDEPTAGMNPRETQEMTEIMGRIRQERGLTIIVIEHDMRVVKGVSDRVVALDYGKKIADGTYEEVANNDRVIEAYLGRKAVAEA